MTDIILRDIQVGAIDSNKLLIIAPTASGKSFIIAGLCDKLERKFKKIAVIVHSAELVKQNIASYEKLNKRKCGVYSASVGKRWQTYKTVVGTIQSIKKISDEFDCVIIDECHKIGAKSYLDFIKNKVFYGLTATPMRDTGKSITSLFLNEKGKESYHLIPYYLTVERGYVNPPFFVDLDLSYNIKRVPKSAKELSKLMKSRDDTTALIVNDYLAKSTINDDERKKGMFFCVDIEHAEYVKKLVPNSCIVHSKMKASERKKVKESKAKYYINVDCLTTGFDVAEIFDIIILRPTSSPSLFVQIVGRGTRLCEYLKKTCCYVYDYSDNVERFPSYKWIIEAYLDHKFKKGVKANQRTCVICDENMIRLKELARYQCSSCDYFEDIEASEMEESVTKNKKTKKSVVYELKDVAITSRLGRVGRNTEQTIHSIVDNNNNSFKLYLDIKHKNIYYKNISRSSLRKIKRQKIMKVNRNINNEVISIVRISKFAVIEQKGSFLNLLHLS